MVSAPLRSSAGVPSVAWRIRQDLSSVVSAEHPLRGMFQVHSFRFKVPSPQQLSVLSPNPQPPIAYTPRHLAERILAEQAAMEARGHRRRAQNHHRAVC